MSPFSKLVILDNNCISNFYVAESLELVLTIWPFKVFVISQRVISEVENWHEHGRDVCRILNYLNDDHKIEIVSINEESEEELDAYMRLRLSGPILGQGESEAIAIAYNRDCIVATDDQIATECCRQNFPSVEIVTTADILKMAKSDGLIKESQINEIWRLIRLKESRQ